MSVAVSVSTTVLMFSVFMPCMFFLPTHTHTHTLHDSTYQTILSHSIMQDVCDCTCILTYRMDTAHPTHTPHTTFSLHCATNPTLSLFNTCTHIHTHTHTRAHLHSHTRAFTNTHMRTAPFRVPQTNPPGLYVGGLRWWTTDQTLTDTFTAFGPLKSLTIFADKVNGKVGRACVSDTLRVTQIESGCQDTHSHTA